MNDLEKIIHLLQNFCVSFMVRLVFNFHVIFLKLWCCNYCLCVG